MLTPGSVLELLVDKPAAGGRMIARHEGQVVLVSATLPGERVRALVERVGQGIGYATTVEVVEASPDRRIGIKDWACGGNVYAHVAYPRQLQLKGEVVADALARIGRVNRDEPVKVAGSPESGYRMRARFHVRGHQVGFFREGTHHLCDPAATGQLLPETGTMVEAIGELLREGALRGVTEIELAENVPAPSGRSTSSWTGRRHPRGWQGSWPCPRWSVSRHRSTPRAPSSVRLRDRQGGGGADGARNAGKRPPGRLRGVGGARSSRGAHPASSTPWNGQARVRRRSRRGSSTTPRRSSRGIGFCCRR